MVATWGRNSLTMVTRKITAMVSFIKVLASSLWTSLLWKQLNSENGSMTAVKELLMFAKNRLIQVLQPQTLRTLSWTPHCYWTDWYWTSNWGSWKRTSDSKTLTEKEWTKANLVGDLDLGATLEYIISSCGVWLAHNILWLWRIMKQRALWTVADYCGLLRTVVDCCGLLLRLPHIRRGGGEGPTGIGI